jgi:hypothetical protein
MQGMTFIPIPQFPFDWFDFCFLSMCHERAIIIENEKNSKRKKEK